jgi:hypothetical protein
MIQPDGGGEMADGDPRGSYVSRQEQGSLPVPPAVYVFVD